MGIYRQSVDGVWGHTTYRLRFAVLSSAGLFFLALLPRLTALGRYVTPDEPIWIYRSVRFREALLSADWASTIQSGHPGVTTTWLGAIAIQLRLWLQPEAQTHLDWLAKLFWLSPDNGAAIQHLATFLTVARLIVALVASLAIVAIYWLSIHRLGRVAALVGAIFLALDPFTAGLSGLFHVDGLLAAFMLITILLVLPKIEVGADGEKSLPTGQISALAGVTTALAVLAKSPGLLLLLIVPAILLWQAARAGSLHFALKATAYWAISLLVSLLILLPAIWADPVGTAGLTGGLAGQLIDSAVRPTFFLGEETMQPDWRFYPLAVAFRLSPVVSLGLIAAVGLILFGLAKKRHIPALANVVWLFVFSLIFVFFINISAKRFDRYALPAFVSLMLVSGWGLAAVASGWIPNITYRRGAILLILFGLIHFSYLLVYVPYPLTAYNWLLGGPAVARNVLPIGWGEATSVAAKWAAAAPDAGKRTLFVNNIPAAAPFYPGRLLRPVPENVARADEDDIFLFSASDWQLEPEAFYEVDEQGVPAPKDLDELKIQQTFHLNGLPRAAVYSGLSPAQLPFGPIPSQERQLRFDQAVQMVSAGALPAAWPDRLRAMVSWQALAPADFQLRLELLDDSGYPWISRELPLLNDVDHSALHWNPNESHTVFYSLPIPPDLAPGDYSLQASLFDGQRARLGVFDANGSFVGTSALISQLTVGPPREQPAITIPTRLSNDLELVGHGELPSQIGSGQTLALDLWWRLTSDSEEVESQLALQLGATTLLADLGALAGRPGQIYHIRPSWRLPVDLPAATYPLALQSIDKEGREMWPEAVVLGKINVSAADGEFALPPGVMALWVRLGSVAWLQGAAVETSGDEIMVDLTWQANQPDGRAYTVFVHLRDSEGNIVDQVDRPPLQSTDSWVAGQVISEKYTLLAPADGHYSIAIGLYDAANGNRLPVFDVDGQTLPADQYVVDLELP